MPDYQKGKIYKIMNINFPNDIYVGSTARKLCQRMAQHRSYSKLDKYQDTKIYNFINNNGGWLNWNIILIEAYPCNSKEELKAKEQHHITLLNSSLNSYLALGIDPDKKRISTNRANRKWRENNKEQMKQIKDAYREAHREEHKAYMREYHKR